MSKYTKGPWQFVPSNGKIVAANELIATIRPTCYNDQLEADGLLIAAAPDLLAACKMIAEAAVSWQGLTPGDLYEVRMAISKAEGHWKRTDFTL